MDQGKDLLRCFSALLPDQESQAQLMSFLDSCARFYPELRWLHADDLHLTLRFYGDIGPEDRELALKALEALPELGQGGLLLSFTHWVFLPGRKKPRVLALKASRLPDQLRKFLALINPNQDPKHFLPHMTLARFRPDQAPDLARLPLPGLSLGFSQAALLKSPQPGSYLVKDGRSQLARYEALLTVRI